MQKYSRQGGNLPSLRETFAFRNLGLGFFWAWCYCLWFVPQVSTSTSLTSASANNLWLLTMVFAAVLHFLIPVLLGQQRRLSQYRWPYWVAPACMVVGSAVLMAALTSAWEVVAVACTVVLGLSSALLWNIWGEFYACAPSNLTFTIAPTFAAVLLACLFITSVVPPLAANIFVCAIPLLSGISLWQAHALGLEKNPPPLLPRAMQRIGGATILKVCVVSSFACVAVTYLWALIPELGFSLSNLTMALGCGVGAIFMLCVYAGAGIRPQVLSITKIYPWVLVVAVVAFCLFILGIEYYGAAYLLAMGTSVVIDVFLVIYFGTFTNNGYTRPSISFGYSEGFICVAMVVGSLLARIVAHISSDVVMVATLLFICVLMVLVIALLKQEFEITGIMVSKRDGNSMEAICDSIAEEFGLSAREQEILELLSLGYSAPGIAERLVISPYTVQTHIKHIYGKIHIHKKTDLLAYLDKQRL